MTTTTTSSIPPTTTTVAPTTTTIAATTTTQATVPVKIVGGNLPCTTDVLVQTYDNAYDPEVSTGQPVCLVVNNVKYGEQTLCGPPGLSCTPTPALFEPNADGGVVWAPLGTGANACPPRGVSQAVVAAFLQAGVHVCGA